MSEGNLKLFDIRSGVKVVGEIMGLTINKFIGSQLINLLVGFFLTDTQPILQVDHQHHNHSINHHSHSMDRRICGVRYKRTISPHRGKGGHIDLLRVYTSDVSPYLENTELGPKELSLRTEAKAVIVTCSGYTLQMLVPTSKIRS
jgi:hypothetical protein